MSRAMARWKVALPLLALAAVAASVLAATATARTGATTTPIRLAILSDCEGAFGASTRPTSAAHRRRSRSTRAAGRQQDEAVRGHDPHQGRRPADPDRGLRLLERHRPEGALGDAAPDGAARRGHPHRPAVGRRGDRRRELREAASEPDVHQRHLGRAGHHAQGAGEELLPLQQRRCPVVGRPGRGRLQAARLAERGRDRRRLQLRVDVVRGPHRRVLRRGRQDQQAGVPAAQHDGLLVVRAAAAEPEPGRRLLLGRRRRGPDPVAQGVRAGEGADPGQEVHGQPVLERSAPVQGAVDPRGRLVRVRPDVPGRHQGEREDVRVGDQADLSVDQRRSPRRCSSTTTTTLRGA